MSLGEAAISPANSLKSTSTINSDGSITDKGNTNISGFTIVEAESLQTAQAMAKSCPFLEIGGSLEVSELIKMPF